MFVYIVKCSDKSYYTGVTNDVERRISEHNLGLNPASYTYSKRPVILKFCEYFENPTEAIEAEKRFKGWSRKKKEALFERDWEELKKLAKTSRSHCHPEPS